MKKLYRIYYGVDETAASCRIYSYPVLDEKNTYFVIQSGRNRKHIKKEVIGVIKNVDIDRISFVVFVEDLSDQDKYISLMIEKVKESALSKVCKFHAILDNATVCDYELIDVEVE